MDQAKKLQLEQCLTRVLETDKHAWICDSASVNPDWQDRVHDLLSAIVGAITEPPAALATPAPTEAMRDFTDEELARRMAFVRSKATVVKRVFDAAPTTTDLTEAQLAMVKDAFQSEMQGCSIADKIRFGLRMTDVLNRLRGEADEAKSTGRVLVPVDSVAARVREVLANAVDEGRLSAYHAGLIETEIISNIINQDTSSPTEE
jgi:hypothetical protein